MRRVFAVASLSAIIAASAGCGLDSLLGTSPPGGKPVLMTGVLATKEEGGYRIQFSLQDEDLEDTSASGSMRITIVGDPDSTKIHYDQARGIKKGDFKKLKTLLGGEVWAYVFFLPSAHVPEYGNLALATMRLHFVLDDGSILEDEDILII